MKSSTGTSALWARLRLAAMHNAAGEWEQAADAYRGFLDAAPKHFFADA